ncbi:MAG: hypothetical protein ABJF79_01565, partial [Paracoccaceae bacterium]
MDLVPTCLLDAEGAWTLGKDCVFGLAAKDIIGLIGLSIIGVLIWIWHYLRKAGRTVTKIWSTLTEHKDWPKYSNLAHQPAPKQ